MKTRPCHILNRANGFPDLEPAVSAGRIALLWGV